MRSSTLRTLFSLSVIAVPMLSGMLMAFTHLATARMDWSVLTFDPLVVIAVSMLFAITTVAVMVWMVRIYNGYLDRVEYRERMEQEGSL